jgi:hypothetical protein
MHNIETLLGNGVGDAIENTIDRLHLRFDAHEVQLASVPGCCLPDPTLIKIKKLSRIIRLEQQLSNSEQWGWM